MISVIVPAFNSEKTIKKTIEAILSQKTKEKIELIIVDDASQDNTVNEIKKFSEKINLIQLKENSGPAKARNTGAKKAKGEIIIFTDSDCIPEKNWLKEMVKPFKDKEVIGVQGAYKTKQKNLIAKFVQLEIEERYNLMKKEMQKKGSIDFIGSYAAAYKRKIFLEFNGFNESFPIASGEDPELSYRMEKKKLKLVFNEKAIVYHLHPESFLKYLKTKFYRGYWRIPLYKKHKEKIIKDSYTPQTLKFQIVLMYAIITALILKKINELIQFNSMIEASFNAFIDTLILLSFTLFLVTMLPFITRTAKKDFLVSIVSPLVIFFRTFAFCTGLIAGSLKAKK
jgi:cellulose synthase/poly-beta-1,6-N-acetylglucosamine synthase-like glycosyltransferase